MNYELEKAGLKKPGVRTDDFGLTDDFYKFIGVDMKNGRSYARPLDDVQKSKKPLTSDFASYYTPADNFYGTPGGTDTVYDQGRVPVSHLMVLCSQRLGVAFRGCNSVANDVFRNKFVFVKDDNLEDEVKRPEILKWMRKTFFWTKMVDVLDFERRTGLGHLVSYWDFEKGTNKMNKRAPKKRPTSFDSFSSFYMTPNNVYDTYKLDYDKNRWNFTGGILAQADIHHSRVYPLETRRVEGGLRGLAIPELCWVPLICYLNTCYYILRSLSQLGTLVIGANIAQEYPTPEVAAKYLQVFEKMRANKFYLFGKNTDFKLVNAAGKIGEGIQSYMEFLKDDISSAWIIPKNQLFGRSEGGGLDGAGALVSKEDYLASNLSTLQLNLTDDIMYILEIMCHFPDMENLTLRWNLDLHKTEQQRLTEELMREQLKQAKNQTVMSKYQTDMMKMQNEQAKMQFEMFKKEPELLMPQQDEQQPKVNKKVVDEDKKQTVKTPKTDFMNDYELAYKQERQYYLNLRINMDEAMMGNNDKKMKDFQKKMDSTLKRMSNLRKSYYHY